MILLLVGIKTELGAVIAWSEGIELTVLDQSGLGGRV
jgi:hypothetical protein